MNDILSSIVIAIITLAGSWGGSLFLLRKTNAEAKKIEAEARATLRSADTHAIEVASATYDNLVKTLQEQIQEQASHIAKLETEIDRQRKEMSELRTKVEGLRDVNIDLLAQNVVLRGRISQYEDLDKLFGVREKQQPK